MDNLTQAAPVRIPAHVIVGAVRVYRKRFEHMSLPMFHADDVIPMLAGEEDEFNAASALLDTDRVYFPPGAEYDLSTFISN